MKLPLNIDKTKEITIYFSEEWDKVHDRHMEPTRHNISHNNNLSIVNGLGFMQNGTMQY